MNEAEVWQTLVGVLEEILAEDGLQLDQIDRKTMLAADVDLESVDTIHLLLTLEDRFGTELSLQDAVLRDGKCVEDISVGELHDFICGKVVPG